MNFCDDEYLSVFAIAMQYTNPSRYSHYTVSLAYQVICIWFLKCKLESRKRYVNFIVRGLVKVLSQFEENISRSRNVSFEFLKFS